MFNFSSRVVVGLFIFLCLSFANAQNKVVVIPLDSTPAPTKYAIGDIGPVGGIVFHVTNGGLNGIEASLVDQAEARWSCFGTDINGVANLANPGDLDPHSGAVITPLIAAACGGASAAAIAAAYVWPNGQTGGFLPNKEELDLLYDQKVAGVVGSFASTTYWSSSEINSEFAWGQSFFNGFPTDTGKGNTRGVRAVRAF